MSGQADDGDPRRWREVLEAAAAWALDVLRGFSWSRHLDRREK